MTFNSGCSCCAPDLTCKCEPCKTGTLPESVLVTFDGPQGSKFQQPIPIALTVNAECFGSGATGTATAPGGTPGVDGGGLTGVTLTSAGSGYAKLGRRAPTITVSGGSGTGATFTPTLGEDKDGCGIPYWFVQSISVTGGQGYEDGDNLTIAATSGDTVLEEAAAVIGAVRKEPASNPYSLSSYFGFYQPSTPATVSATFSNNGNSTWGVSSVELLTKGSGYVSVDDPFSGTVSLTLDAGPNEVMDSQAFITGQMKRIAPTISIVPGFVQGSGAQFSVSLTEYDGVGGKYWDGVVSVVNGGSGYEEGDSFYATGPFGSYADGSVFVSKVEGGTITEVEGGVSGWGWDGILDSVSVVGGGEYYRRAEITGVVVNAPGKYWREDASLTPYVDKVSVAVSDASPSNGVGAKVNATVNANTASPSFGSISGLTIEDGGSGYLGWRWAYCDCEFIEGGEIGATYAAPGWRDNSYGECSYRVPRCYTHPNLFASPSSEWIGPLLGLKIDSPVGYLDYGTSGGVVAPDGIPGIHEGPITAANTFATVKDSTTLRFAFAGREEVVVNRLYPGEHAITAVMEEIKENGWLPYWRVESVTVPAGITGFASGDIVELDNIDYRYNPGQFSIGSWYGEPTPARKVAKGLVVLGPNGDIGSISIFDRGVFYRECHSTPDPLNPGCVKPPIQVPTTITVNQRQPSNGTDAEFALTLNTNTRALGFGTVTGINVVNGGNGYLRNITAAYSRAPGVTPQPHPRVQYCSPPGRPQVRNIDSSCAIGPIYRAPAPIEDCSQFEFPAYFDSSVVYVEPGPSEPTPFFGSKKCCGRGDFAQFFLPGRCKVPREITLSIDLTYLIEGNVVVPSYYKTLSIPSVVLSLGGALDHPTLGYVTWGFGASTGSAYQSETFSFVSVQLSIQKPNPLYDNMATAPDFWAFVSVTATLWKNLNPPPLLLFNWFTADHEWIQRIPLSADGIGAATPGAGLYCPAELEDAEFSGSNYVPGVGSGPHSGTVSVIDIQ